jgi:hypothetical protein
MRKRIQRGIYRAVATTSELLVKKLGSHVFEVEPIQIRKELARSSAAHQHSFTRSKGLSALFILQPKEIAVFIEQSKRCTSVLQACMQRKANQSTKTKSLENPKHGTSDSERC